MWQGAERKWCEVTLRVNLLLFPGNLLLSAGQLTPLSLRQVTLRVKASGPSTPIREVPPLSPRHSLFTLYLLLSLYALLTPLAVVFGKVWDSVLSAVVNRRATATALDSTYLLLSSSLLLPAPLSMYYSQTHCPRLLFSCVLKMCVRVVGRAQGNVTSLPKTTVTKTRVS